LGDGLRRLEPVHAWHLDVEDHEVGLLFAHELDRGVAAAGVTDHDVTLLLEDLLEVEADDRLVLGDDDAGVAQVGRPFRVGAGGTGGWRIDDHDSSAAMRSSKESCSRSSSAIEPASSSSWWRCASAWRRASRASAS